MAALYDTIGASYSRYRRPDPRIRRAIEDAVGDATSVVSVGAGTGSYEPGTTVVSIEPSRTMIDQRPATAAPAIQGVAECMPLRDGAFDAALAILTVHHWPDWAAGLRDMQRIAPRQVVLTWDAVIFKRFWLVEEYLPAIAEFEASMPTLEAIADVLDAVDIRVVPVPWDCSDGFLGAYWRRPERYLDPPARSAISTLSLMDQDVVSASMARLARDIANGTWHDRHGDLTARSELDLGYRLVIATSR